MSFQKGRRSFQISDPFLFQGKYPVYIHPSVAPENTLRKQIRFLKKGIIDPSLHYRSSSQVSAWSEVFQRHCPVLKDRSFTQIYKKLFKEINFKRSSPVHLIGLGCGTGDKEFWLAKELIKNGTQLSRFTAVDVGRDLCFQSIRRLSRIIPRNVDGCAMDLDMASDLRSFLDQTTKNETRVFTFFGLVPNMSPEQVFQILQKLKRKGDRFLISANLAPVFNESKKDWDRAMHVILPQYENRETKKWLRLLFREQGLGKGHFNPLSFKVVHGAKFSSIRVQTSLLKSIQWGYEGASLRLKAGMILNVFQSRRWTPENFERELLKRGWKVAASKITSNREEGVWELLAVH